MIIAGRNSNMKIIKYLINIMNKPTLYSIPALIQTNCYDGILLFDEFYFTPESIENYCKKFESICLKITKAKAVSILESLLQNKSSAWNFARGKEGIFFNTFYNGPIHWICMSGSPKVAKIFFEILNKIDLYKLNKQNKTGIYYLVGKKTKNVIKILKILLEKGYDINFKPNGGNSILTDFVFHFNPDLEVIEFLLQNGANARIMTTQNKILYERIEESINNQLFYTQSQNQIKLKIFQLFERYSQLNKEEEEEEEEAIKEKLNNDTTDTNYNNEVENKE